MARLSILALCAMAAFALGCGDSNGGGTGADGGGASAGEASDDGLATKQGGGKTAMVANRSSRGRKIKAVDSEYGPVVADARGEAFYLFDKEKGKRSRCYGACARAWPPVLTQGRPRGGSGVTANLLGTTKRKNGRLQVTYRGHPLYYYVDDSPGTILCQNVAEFGGLWLVVKPNGNPVT